MAIDDYNDDLEIMLIPPQVQFLLLETLNCWPEVKMHNLKILINCSIIGEIGDPEI